MNQHLKNQQPNKTSAKNSNARTSVLQDTDIIELILEDHKPLKELINVMKDTETTPEERFATFKEFAPALVAHAKPEEEVLYKQMKKTPELLEGAFEGEVEHQMADQLVEEIKRTEDIELRSARIKVLAELVEHHIEEEEEEMLPDFEKESDIEDRRQMGGRFLEAKVNYLAAGDDNVIPDPKFEGEFKH